MAAPPGVLHLANQQAVVRAHPIGQAAQVIQHAVVIGAQTLWSVLRRNAHRIGHHHGRAAFGPVDVIVPIARMQTLVRAKAGRNGSVGDAVFQPMPSQYLGAEQAGVGGLIHGHWQKAAPL